MFFVRHAMWGSIIGDTFIVVLGVVAVMLFFLVELHGEKEFMSLPQKFG